MTDKIDAGLVSPTGDVGRLAGPRPRRRLGVIAGGPAILPLAGLFAGALLLIGATIYLASLRQDAIQKAHEEQVVVGSQRAVADALAGNVVDYAVWDDAVRYLTLDFDRAWAASNIGPTVHANLGYDVSLVVDGDGRVVYGQLAGVEDAAGAASVLGARVGRLVDQARQRSQRAASPAALAVLDGPEGLFMAAASAIVPELASALSLPRGAPLVLLFAKRIDAAFLGRLASDFGVNGLALAGPETALGGRASFDLRGPDGEIVGRLAWTPRHPGQDQLAWILPALAGALLAAGLFATQARRETRLAAALRESEGRFRSIGDSVPVMVWVIDPSGACTYVNRRWYEYTGQRPGEGEGKGWLACICPEDLAAARGAMEAALARREPFQIEYRLRRHDGAWRWMFDAGTPRFDRTGAFLGYVGAIVDIDERKATEAALRAARHAAESAARAKSEFLAAMSHEIRTPMTGVLGMADLLAAERLSASQARYVDTIRTSGRHLLSIINDILDFSRIEAGRLELERIDFAPADILEGVQSLMAPQAAERGLRLQLELATPPELVVKGDPTRLRQVLVNLVGNGLKFTARGEVRVGVTALPAEAGVRLRFEVKDTGIGIPKERQAALFEAFVQADSSTTRHYGGSGLGLVICKRLVLAMGGTIGVDSEPGQGSRFWFELVFARGDAQEVAQRSALEPASIPPLRVLVADDVPANRELLEEMLRRHGHAVRLAENGAAAVEAAQRERFDVVLMDVQMPVMDGMEATRRIRRLPPPAGEVPILALTANVMTSEQARYLAAGMDLCLTKPVVWPDLFATLAGIAVGGRPSLAKSQGQLAAAPSVPAIEAVPLLDRPLLEGMARSLPRAAIEKLLAQGLDGVGQSCRRLGAALGDPETLAQEAHRLRGTAGTFGLARVSALAAVIEDRLGRGEDVADTIAELEEIVAATHAAMELLALAQPA